MIYEVNVALLGDTDLIQLLEFVYNLGFYKVSEERPDYDCTTKMIDILANALRDIVAESSDAKKVQLAIGKLI